MARLLLLLVALLAISMLVAIPANAQAMTPDQSAMTRTGEYQNVSGLQPFTAEANYMSLPGYLRLVTFREQGLWISYAEARRIVLAQGGLV